MTDRAGKGISGIGVRQCVQAKQSLNHILDLLLCRFAMPNDGFLDLQGSVFMDEKVAVGQCTQRCSTGLTEQQGRLRVGVDEHDLECGDVRTRVAHDFT